MAIPAFDIPENLITDYNLSLELKELGVIQTESLHYYNARSLMPTKRKRDYILKYLNRYIAAFTTTELGWMLPPYTVAYLDQRDYSWGARYDEDLFPELDSLLSYNLTDYDTEAEAKGELLARLLQDEVTTVEEVNYRLANADMLMGVKDLVMWGRTKDAKDLLGPLELLE